MESTKRVRWLDSVKGLAIVLVVWGHIALYAGAARVFVYAFHLPVFFVVTGILRARRDEAHARWRFSRRAAQLLYPYATFSLLIVLYLACLGRWGDAESALWQTLCLYGYNTLWFLPACLLAECIFVLVRKSRVPDRWGSLALVAGTCAVSLVLYKLQYSAIAALRLAGAVINGVNRAAVGAVFILCGYHGYFRLRRRIAKSSPAAVCACGATLLLGGAVLSQANGLVDLRQSQLNMPPLFYLCAALGSAGVILLLRQCGGRCRLLAFFGENSLVIMATHYAFPFVQAASALTAGLSALPALQSVATCAVVMLMESALVLALRRYAPFLIRPPRGKKAAA